MDSRLRVALFLESWSAPAWVAATIEEVRSLPCVSIELVVTDGTRPRGRRSYLRLDRLYMHLERWLWRGTPDALELRRLDSLVGVPSLRVVPSMTEGEFDLDPKTLKLLRLRRLDVALLFGFGRPSREVVSTAKYGFWSHREIDALAAHGSPPGLEEVLHREPTTEWWIVARSKDLDEPVQLAGAVCYTDHRLAARGRNDALWRAPGMIAGALLKLSKTDRCSPLRPRPSEGAVRTERRLSNVEVVTRVASSVARYARDIHRRRGRDLRWTLAYRWQGPAEGIPGDITSYRPIPTPLGRNWADPFPYRRDGRSYIFFEDQPVSTRKGRICVLELDEAGCVGSPRPVLERPYHLSYPFLLEWRSKLFMILASPERRRIELYRCEQFPGHWGLEKTLMDGLRAVDTTVSRVDGRWWLFTCIAPEGTWNVDQLYLFHADSPLGPWRPHASNPVVSDVRGARPAGGLFRCGGMLCRPAQDCSRGYGGSIRIFEITQLTVDRYAQRPRGLIKPDWIANAIGTHTINQHQGLVAVDVRQYTRARGKREHV